MTKEMTAHAIRTAQESFRGEMARRAPASSLDLSIHDASTGVEFDLVRRISSLFRLQYGSNYHRYVIDEPETVRRLIEAGEWIAFVIRNDEGELVAHAGLVRSGKASYKFARTVVHPSARGAGLGDLLTDARLLYLKRLGRTRALESIATDAVTTHPVSQNAFVKRGFLPTSVQFGKLSDYFATGARETAVTLTRILDDAAKRRRELFVPVDCVPVVRHILDLHGASRTLVANVPPGAEGKTKRSETSVDYSDLQGMGLLMVTVSGTVDPEGLVAYLERERTRGAKFIGVKVECGKARSLRVSTKLRQAGYVCNGLEITRNADYLLFQSRTPELETFQVEGLSTEEARLLAELARAQLS